MVPIIHMNVRYFEAGESWWFGGGIDASPHYISVSEASGISPKAQECLRSDHESFYPRFKKMGR